MRVWTDEGKAIVKCDYSEKEIIKAIGDYKFDKTSKTWVFPVKKLLRIIDQLKVEYSSETQEVYESLRKDLSAYHAKVNLANRIKKGEDIQIPGLTPDYLTMCMSHQIKAIKLGALFGSYAFFLETGTGKTLVDIVMMEYFKVPAMVVAPLYSLEKTWMVEIDKWSKLRGKKPLKTVNLWNNLKEFKRGYDVYLINYEQFKKLHKQTGGKIHEIVQSLSIDESSKLKNHDSDIAKTIVSYREKIPHRFDLTGTPNPNNLMEYWGQITFINPDLLPDNFYKFRNTFFKPVGYGGFQYVPMPGAKEAIMDKVSMQSIAIKKEECVDLPERIFEQVTVYMDDLQVKAYDMMLKENILHFESHTTVGVNELSKLMKLRQITSGFTITDEQIPVNISKTKIEALLEVIDKIPQDRQIIIWCQFHFEIEALHKLFPDAALVYGGVTPKEKDEHLTRWLSNQTRILIGHPKSGGTSLNLQQCSYMIWFDISYSLEEFAQACDRIYRNGQKNICTYYLLIARREDSTLKKDRTVDEIIYEVLIDKKDLMQSCMEMLKG